MYNRCQYNRRLCLPQRWRVHDLSCLLTCDIGLMDEDAGFRVPWTRDATPTASIAFWARGITLLELARKSLFPREDRLTHFDLAFFAILAGC